MWSRATGAKLRPWPPTKIATQYLAPYLMGREEAERLHERPPGAKPVERDLELLGAPRLLP